MRALREWVDNSVYHGRAGILCGTLVALATSVSFPLPAPAASLYTEDFQLADGGWQDRDPSEMAVGFSSPSFGNPAGSLQGTFALQGTPGPETDAFRADGTGNTANFMGDYFTDVPTFTSWVFDFYADDVLPSDLIVRFGDGVNTFFRSVSSQVTSIDAWHQVTVSLSYAGWFGGSLANFNSALGGVSFIDLQITRNGAGAQNFFVDNFQLAGGGGGGGGGSAVPEPQQGLLILGAMVLFAARRTTRFVWTRTRA